MAEAGLWCGDYSLAAAACSIAQTLRTVVAALGCTCGWLCQHWQTFERPCAWPCMLGPTQPPSSLLPSRGNAAGPRQLTLHCTAGAIGHGHSLPLPSCHPMSRRMQGCEACCVAMRRPGEQRCCGGARSASLACRHHKGFGHCHQALAGSSPHRPDVPVVVAVPYHHDGCAFCQPPSPHDTVQSDHLVDVGLAICLPSVAGRWPWTHHQ